MVIDDWSMVYLPDLHDALIIAIDALKDTHHGKWIDLSDGGRIRLPWWEHSKCSNCGYLGSGTANFCPNCKADMRGINL